MSEAMNWTTEPLKVPGWYWTCRYGGRHVVEVVAREPDKVLCILGARMIPLSERPELKWLGPLPIPEPPKEDAR